MDNANPVLNYVDCSKNSWYNQDNFKLGDYTMKITIEERKQSKEKEYLFNRLARVCYKMHDRCNNPNQAEYKYYGGEGVTYCDKWSSVKGFLDDVDKMQGWDEEEFLAHRLQLDKDYHEKGNKYYSKETCRWVSPKENMNNMPHHQRDFYAYNLDTDVTEEGHSVKKFCAEKHISYSTALRVLKHKRHRSGSWVLWYKDEEKPDIYWHGFLDYRNYGTKLNI